MWISSRSKPASRASSAARAKSAIDALHVRARHLARHGAAVGKVRNRRRRDERPAALGERLVVAFPQPLRRALAPGVTELDADLRAASRRARNRRRASRRRRAPACRDPAHHGEMRASRDTSVISAITRPAPPIARLPRCTRCQSPTVPSSATYWHIGDTTTRLGSTRSRSRNGVNIGGGVTAGRDACGRCPPDVPPRRATQCVDAREERRIARTQILVRDAQRSRQQREGERHRIERHVPLGVLEPLQRRLRRTLQALDLRAPRSPRRREARPRSHRVPRARPAASRSATASSIAIRVPDPTEKCAVCAASPRSTTWPLDHGSVRIVGNCRHTLRFVIEPVAVELLGEQPLEKCGRLLLGRAIHARRPATSRRGTRR